MHTTLALSLCLLAGCGAASLEGLPVRSLELGATTALVCPGSQTPLVLVAHMADGSVWTTAGGRGDDAFSWEGIEIAARGPGTVVVGDEYAHLEASSDIAQSLEGPIELRVRSTFHPKLEPASLTLPITHACAYVANVRGRDGASGRSGSSGDDGRDGDDGRRATQTEPGTPGGHGGHGGDAGDGGDGSDGRDAPRSTVTLEPIHVRGRSMIHARVEATDGTTYAYLVDPDGGSLFVDARGGDGGDGGDGGRGGDGGDGGDGEPPGAGGNGGRGGDGGDGARGGRGGEVSVRMVGAASSFLSRVTIAQSGGRAGRAGSAGAGGDAGRATASASQGQSGRWGSVGSPGADGVEGPAPAVDAVATSATIGSLLETRTTAGGERYDTSWLDDAFVTGVDRRLSAVLRIPRQIALTFDACTDIESDVLAQWESSQRTIRICVDRLYAIVAAGVRRSDVAGYFRFVLLHEIGHALVDELDLPVVGREESAVDQFATLALLHLDPGALRSTTRVLDDARGSLPAWDEHLDSAQTRADVACLMHGANSGSQAPRIPAARRERCEVEHASAIDAWNTLLAPHLRDGIERMFRR